MDFQRINHEFDLLGLAQGLSELKHSGRWWVGPCPFCGGEDRFQLKQGTAGWVWFCRGCGEGKYHNAVDFAARLFPGEALPAAVRRIAGQEVLERPSRPLNAPKASPVDPAAGLLPAWKNVIEYGQSLLWSPAGRPALDYLHARGFTERTLRSPWHRIGWSEGRKIDGCWVERGIVLPCFRLDMQMQIAWIDYIKVRRLPKQTWLYHSEREEKYRKLAGGGPGLYGYHWINVDIVFVTEGEFDALVLFQEACDLVGSCTLGSASERLDIARWGLDFLPVAQIYLAYDNDTAGKAGAEAWGSLGGRVLHARVPAPYKDINDYFTAGGDVAAWVMETLRLGRPGS